MKRGSNLKQNVYVHLLQHKSFVPFWGSTTLLRLASNVLQFALAIYVLDLTGSAFVYSTVLSIIILPRVLCTSAAGYLADFKDSIKILKYGTAGLTGLMACFLAMHTFVMPLNVPLIYGLVIGLELCETLIAPSEGKILPCIVKTEEIAPASKLSSLDDGIVELLSPVIGGLCYSLFGLTSVLGMALILEGMALLLTTQIQYSAGKAFVPQKTAPQQMFSFKNTCNAYKEAFACLKKYPHLIGIILFAPLFNFFVSPLFSVTAPHYFRVTMQGSVDLYAMFNMVLGVAGLIAPFLAMVFISDQDERRANKGGTLVSAVILLCLIGVLRYGKNALSANGTLYAVTVAMALLVAVITIMNIATSITFKKQIPEQMMGRVLSVLQLCAAVSVPLGQLFYGLCTDRFPIELSLLISVIGLAVTFAVMAHTYRAVSKTAE